jgi:hypothetical protein
VYPASLKAFMGLTRLRVLGTLIVAAPVESSYIRAHGTCDETSYQMVRLKVERFGLSDHVIIVPGFFHETFPVVDDP